MKLHMTTETVALISIILVCCLFLTAADTIISLLLHFLFGISMRKAFLWGLLSLFIPPVFTAYGALVERNIFVVKNVEIRFDDLPESFEGYRIAHISDIHARSFIGREKQMEKAVFMINGTSADLIAFTGDLITISPDELDGQAEILAGLHAEDGVISILGNHDYCQYSDLSEEAKDAEVRRLMTIEKDMGWDLLMNENRIIRRGQDSLAIIGVENTSPSRHFFSKGDFMKASQGTEGMFRIVLTHDPLHWEDEIVGKDYPLTLSGHTHAMQFSLPGWSPSRLIFKQYRGLYSQLSDRGQQYIHVNIGLGETIFPARIGTRPEITLITLRGNKL